MITFLDTTYKMIIDANVQLSSFTNENKKIKELRTKS